jgi:sugar lactone lactonase YvrE
VPYFPTVYSPAALAFDSSDNLFVADWQDNAIYRITPSGEKSIFATGLIMPRALAFDSIGNLFVADGCIYKYTPSGEQSVFATGLIQPRALAFDTDGNLFEADYGSNSIYKFTPDGNRSTFVTGLDRPTALAFSPIPEPSSLVLAIIGAISLLVGKRRTTPSCPISETTAASLEGKGRR